jgi:GMP synthase-like glutamine amidotransferase
MILIIDINKSRLSGLEFVLPLERIVDMNFMTVHYTEVNEGVWKKASHIILSGTPLMDNDFINYVDNFAWLKKTKVPVLGICAGMQVIGLLFGEKIITCREIGMAKIVTLNENPLFKGEFQAYALHNNSVSTRTFEHLAESSYCVEAFKHKKMKIYGVLFHPEVRNPEIIRNFLKL